MTRPNIVLVPLSVASWWLVICAGPSSAAAAEPVSLAAMVTAEQIRATLR